MEMVTGALPSLLPKLANLLIGEYNLHKEVKGGIRFLQTELEIMKAALEEISETPPDKLNKVHKIWARDVRELSYDIEDKIDTFMVRCKGSSRLAEQNGLNKAIDRSLNWLMQPKIRRKIATDIRDIKSRVLEVHDRRRRYEVNKQSVDKPVEVDSRALVRYEEVTKLVGIDEARDEVIRILMEGNELSMQQDKIVSIVGFGGLGKTTLANVVYEKLRGQFGCSAFVSVSQTPDMEKLFNDLLYKFGVRNNNASINIAIDELRGLLQEKRYFIVLDDIWDISDWKRVRCALPDNSRGCIIITTTRDLKVAEEVGFVYKMKPLCLQTSRILLYKRIFGDEGKDKCLDEELVKVSDRILAKCAGVPLAIITIASLLASKGRNKLDWYEVCNSIGTGMEGNTDVENMRKVLSLSYYDMPFLLRTCLLHVSVFPEDYEICKRRLIWMWIAEGFIQGGKQGQSQFEVGESYFNELVNRSMIQPIYEYSNNMKINFYRVHDMVLDLIRYLSSEENFITFSTLNNVGSASQKARRLSLENDKRVGDGIKHGDKMSMKQVRSVVAFSSAINLIPTLSRFEVVRVLHLENCDLSHGYNLKYVGKLVHLRWLGLRSAKIVHLPEEIGSLQFLQMLDISDNAISTLPFTIVQLRQLKCLYIDYDTRMMLMPTKGIGGLTSIEELSRLVITDSSGIEDLGHLTELRVLDINVYFHGMGGHYRETSARDLQIQSGADPSMELVECLHKLQNMQNLSICIAECSGHLDGWIGPQNLRSLKVEGYTFLKLPVWINPSHVENLSFLEISVNELEPEDLEILGRLPALRDLEMWSTCSREYVASAGSFPCLVQCRLMGDYERVVFRQGAMPRLTSIELHLYRSVWSAWNSTGIPDLGFENLPSLLGLRVGLRCGKRSASADEARAALRNMAEIHPNHPTISAPGYRY